MKVILHTKFRGPRSNGSARRALTNRHTDGQTDGTDFIPSTADAGGKNNMRLVHLKTGHFGEKKSIDRYVFLLLRMLQFLIQRFSNMKEPRAQNIFRILTD